MKELVRAGKPLPRRSFADGNVARNYVSAAGTADIPPSRFSPRLLPLLERWPQESGTQTPVALSHFRNLSSSRVLGSVLRFYSAPSHRTPFHGFVSRPLVRFVDNAPPGVNFVERSFARRDAPNETRSVFLASVSGRFYAQSVTFTPREPCSSMFSILLQKFLAHLFLDIVPFELRTNSYLFFFAREIRSRLLQPLGTRSKGIRDSPVRMPSLPTETPEQQI